MKPWHKHAATALVATAMTVAAMKVHGPAGPIAPIPTIEIPATMKTLPGKSTKITATTKAALVQWFAPDGCELEPSETGHWAMFVSTKPGRYKIAAWTTVNGTPTPAAVCEVEVAGDTPAPGPAPGPAPAPNALTPKLQAAYDLDKRPLAAKADDKVMLIGIYQALAVKSKDLNVKSTAELMAQLRAAVTGLLKPESLAEVRQLVANEARLTFGEVPATLDDALRARLATFWTGIADALKAVK